MEPRRAKHSEGVTAGSVASQRLSSNMRLFRLCSVVALSARVILLLRNTNRGSDMPKPGPKIVSPRLLAALRCISRPEAFTIGSESSWVYDATSLSFSVFHLLNWGLNNYRQRQGGTLSLTGKQLITQDIFDYM